MWAGVHPGLQILWACLWWADRFDSDALPPNKSGQWTVANNSKRTVRLFAASHSSLVIVNFSP